MGQQYQSSVLVITFDDGNLCQFKWARGMHSGGMKGTFYVNPSTIGDVGKLKMWQLRKMHDEWGHVIANHMWEHISGMDITPDEAVESVKRTDEWLVKNNFSDGVGLLALPYGFAGGRWADHLEKLKAATEQTRDTGRSGINKFDFPCTYPIAQFDSVAEAFEMLNNLESEKEKHIYTLLFHLSVITYDPYFLRLLNRICELVDEKKVQVVTTRELMHEFV